ncbi:MAG: hypothetical protein ACAI44_38355 [Candidatus Sericytochromatia bacterium]
MDIINRKVVPVPESFFCDGPYDLITTTSLGGSDLNPAQLVNCLQSDDPAQIRELLGRGIALPLFFPGDCALDRAMFVVGELTEQESTEWIGRISARLEVPYGKVVLIAGGGDLAGVTAALSEQEPGGSGELCFQLEVPPGSYVIEILAYIGSMNVDFYFEDHPLPQNWFELSGDERPFWIEHFQHKGMLGDLDGTELVGYLIHLDPLVEAPPLPALVPEIGWCGEFEFREPKKCPHGLMRAMLLAEADAP